MVHVKEPTRYMKDFKHITKVVPQIIHPLHFHDVKAFYQFVVTES